MRGGPVLSQFPDQRQTGNIMNTVTKHQIRDIRDKCIQTVFRYNFSFRRLLSGFPQTHIFNNFSCAFYIPPHLPI